MPAPRFADYIALNIELAAVTQKLAALESRWLEEADRLSTGE